MSSRSQYKKLLIIAHDLAMTALAATLALALRFDGAAFTERASTLAPFLPVFVVLAGLVYSYFHLYRGKWRFASMPDLIMIMKAVGVICLVLTLAEYAVRQIAMDGQYYLGRRLIILYWLVQCALLGAPRLVYRYGKDRYVRVDPDREVAFALLLGRGNEVEPVIRALEANRERRIVPVAILSPRNGDLGQTIRGVPVEGTFDQLEDAVQQAQVAGTPIRRLLATRSALERNPEELARRAMRLGLALARLEAGSGTEAVFSKIEIEDLLSRPAIALEPGLLESAVRGKRVLVTGGGGSIGAVICRRALALGARSLVVIENAEPALHTVLASLGTIQGESEIIAHLADVRDKARIHQIMAELQPDVVFHAAALKQVPYLERDWDEGIKTNIFGSINVADAAIAAGVPIVVMISTDKAVQPVSVLGATKRFAEHAMTARDAVHGARLGGTRLISVRFGNVLGSSGSVIPVFRQQIARGGPVTVTDPEMVRYFMTLAEATDLTIVAAAHAGRAAGGERISVYVLRMGEPVRIMDLAERMIRLAGHEPGQDITIRVTGVRPGERINEQLFAESEAQHEIGIEGVMAASAASTTMAEIDRAVVALQAAIDAGSRHSAEAILKQAVPDFSPAPITAPSRAVPFPAAPAEQADPAASPVTKALMARQAGA